MFLGAAPGTRGGFAGFASGSGARRAAPAAAAVGVGDEVEVDVALLPFLSADASTFPAPSESLRARSAPAAAILLTLLPLTPSGIDGLPRIAFACACTCLRIEAAPPVCPALPKRPVYWPCCCWGCRGVPGLCSIRCLCAATDGTLLPSCGWKCVCLSRASALCRADLARRYGDALGRPLVLGPPLPAAEVDALADLLRTPLAPLPSAVLLPLKLKLPDATWLLLFRKDGRGMTAPPLAAASTPSPLSDMSGGGCAPRARATAPPP